MAKTKLSEYQHRVVRELEDDQVIVSTLEATSWEPDFTMSGTGRGIRPQTVRAMVRKGVLQPSRDSLGGLGPPQTYRLADGYTAAS